MKKQHLLIATLIIISSLILFKLIKETNQHKGLIESLISINEQTLTRNTDIIESINHIGFKLSFLKADPSSRKKTIYNELILFSIKNKSNTLDDYFLTNLNKFIEKEGNIENWFTKNAHNQRTEQPIILFKN